MVAEEGFEPSQCESESQVLPLHNSASNCFIIIRKTGLVVNTLLKEILRGQKKFCTGKVCGKNHLRHSERGAAFRAGRGIPGRARHLREEPLLHWTHSPLQNGGYSSLPKGDTAPCKMGGIAPCRRGHTAPCKMGGYSSLPKGTHSPLATLGTRLAKETEDVL